MPVRYAQGIADQIGLDPVAHRRPYRVTTDSAHARPIVPNVLDRRFDGWGPNQPWIGDITYIATDQPTTLRLARSITQARYSQPSAVDWPKLLALQALAHALLA